MTIELSDRLLTPPEAAKFLAVSPRTLWGLTKSRQIRCVRINNWTIRYDPSDLRDWIEKQKDESTPPGRNKKMQADC